MTLLRSAYNAAARHGVHALNTQPVVGNTLASVNLRREAGLDTRTSTQVCYKVNQNSLTRARRAEHRQLGLRLVPHGWCAWSLRRVQQPGTSRYRGKTSGAVTARTNDVITRGEHVNTAAKVSPASPRRHQPSLPPPL